MFAVTYRKLHGRQDQHCFNRHTHIHIHTRTHTHTHVHTNLQEHAKRTRLYIGNHNCHKFMRVPLCTLVSTPGHRPKALSRPYLSANTPPRSAVRVFVCACCSCMCARGKVRVCIGRRTSAYTVITTGTGPTWNLNVPTCRVCVCVCAFVCIGAIGACLRICVLALMCACLSTLILGTTCHE